jgi:hypothetical protein
MQQRDTYVDLWSWGKRAERDLSIPPQPGGEADVSPIDCDVPGLTPNPKFDIERRDK